MKRICITIIVLFSLFTLQPPACAEEKGAGPSDMRLQKAYHEMLLADQAREKSDIAQAINHYKKALEIYKDLSVNFPEEKKETVKFRTVYCNNQLKKLIEEADKEKVRKDAVVGSVPVGDSEKVKKLIRAATAFMKKDEPDQARPILMSALNLDPDNSELRFLVGVSQCQAGKFTDALYLLENLSEEEPKNAGVYVALSSVYLSMNDSAGALRKMERALAIDSKNPEINFNMAQLLLVVDPPSPEEAMEYYKTAIRLGAEPDEQLEEELKKF